MSAELFDGWIPMFLAPQKMSVQYAEMMKIRRPDFEIAAAIPVVIDDDIDKARAQIKQNVGFYVGGMGGQDLQCAQRPRWANGLCRCSTRDSGSLYGR